MCLNMLCVCVENILYFVNSFWSFVLFCAVFVLGNFPGLCFFFFLNFCCKMTVPLLADALPNLCSRGCGRKCNSSQCKNASQCAVGGGDALQELWITRCIGDLPLARCIRPVSVCRTKEGLSGCLGGDSDAEDIFLFCNKNPFFLFTLCTFTV